VQSAPRILVVDDQVEVREVLKDLLTVAGYSVSAVGGGLAALLRIGAERPACLILDLKLDDVSGFEIYRVLREDPDFRDLPVLFISGAYPDGEWVRRQLGTGPIRFLSKPMKHEDLTRTLEELLA
jgi:CheY-like chemotaxis protein